MMLLKDKTCLITGASRGLGAAIARTYAKEGASLILAGRTEDDMKQVADECKKLGAAEVQVKVVDFTSSEAVQRLGDDLAAAGSVDVLVNNAGMAIMENCLEGSPEIWDTLMAVNVAAPLRLTRLLAPQMKEKRDGVIINMCSTAGLVGVESAAAYCASKFALRGWSMSCYETLRDHNVKVMAINPGPTNTDMVTKSELLMTFSQIQGDWYISGFCRWT
eukprot:Lankesteria_metandrocarpae@DN5264_c0_g2_i5.p1